MSGDRGPTDEPYEWTHWIGGQLIPPTENRGFITRSNPVDQRVVSRVANGDAAVVDHAVQVASDSFPAWRTTRPSSRSRVLAEIALLVRASLDELAAIEQAETGKPDVLAAREVEGAAQFFEFFAHAAALPAGDVLDLGSTTHVYTRHEPFGVVGLITPWNMPLNQAARAAAPAIAAGNTVVAKPSEYTSGTTLRLAQLCAEAGLPNGVMNVVLGTGSDVGEPLVTHPSVRKVAFTGSVATGRAVGRVAADRVIPLTLELGGKSANIIFADADLAAAVRATVVAFTTNAGQVCSAGTRLLVQRPVHDEVVDMLTVAVAALDPLSDVGPLVTETQLARVTEYLEVAAAEGLSPAIGGNRYSHGPCRHGNFIPATVFTGLTNDHRLAREEIFGPVLVVIPFEGESEAIRIANDSEYGLVAGVWTRDGSRGLRVAGALEAGQVFVNSWTTGAVETPFGGYKLSGYGREKGVDGLRQYQQVKSVSIAL